LSNKVIKLPESVADLLMLLTVPDTTAKRLTLSDWDLVVRQARSAGLLGRLNAILSKRALIGSIPVAVAKHLRWGGIVTKRHAELVRFEVDEIGHVLKSISGPIVLLKGAAYSYCEIDSIDGRLFSDIDILLKREDIGKAEKLLEMNGWLATHLSDYDQSYYRTWMHEIPPLKHGLRQTELDVHHAILPLSARVKTDSNLLFQRIVPVNPEQTVFRLSDEDMLLHSMSHLFFDGEFKRGFRDLDDIRSLLLDFTESDKSWSDLVSRAVELGLSHPCFYALIFSRDWFGVEVPESVLCQLKKAAKLRGLRDRWMRYLFSEALLPLHPTTTGTLNTIARYFLYIRSHFLRMPINLLIPHLLYKAFLPLLESFQRKKKLSGDAGILQILEEQANTR
tara:strand:+ start:4488 stop:5666 length:1179 start_codon:yes stop_codon:yes gene_type:complete